MAAERLDAEVVIAGGGIAGMTTAAALADLGLRVVVIEAGQHMERRLTGELIHPPGVAGLVDLGLLAALLRRGPARVRGFAVFHPEGWPMMLDYAPPEGPMEDGPALALDHVQIRHALIENLAARPGIDLRLGRRVTAAEAADGDALAVAVEDHAGGRERLRARLLVGADGAASPVRRLAGIGCRRRRVSTIHGFVVPADAVPCPAYGNVFFGSHGPILAYAIGQNRARVLFDHRAGLPADGTSCRGDLGRLPPELAAGLAQAIAEQRLLGFAIQVVEVDSVTRGRIVLVGDAAGTCHPLTASGMTASIADALSLRDAIRAVPDDLTAALARHRRARRGAQLTRMAMATALHEIYCGDRPALQVMRLGLLRYWRRDPRNRSRSMALLSTVERSRLRLAIAMGSVALHGLAAWHDERRPSHGLDLAGLAAISGGLAGTLARHGRGLWTPRWFLPVSQPGIAE